MGGRLGGGQAGWGAGWVGGRLGGGQAGWGAGWVGGRLGGAGNDHSYDVYTHSIDIDPPSSHSQGCRDLKYIALHTAGYI